MQVGLQTIKGELPLFAAVAADETSTAPDFTRLRVELGLPPGSSG